MEVILTRSFHTDFHTMYHPDAMPNTSSPRASSQRSQILHRDQHLQKINDQLDGKGGAATRNNTRRQPPPYSALCSFQPGTSLSCVAGSHLVNSREYKKEDGVDCPLPLGWGLLWHGLFVHAGAECSVPWHARLHMYLRVLGRSDAVTGKIDLAEAS